MALFGNLQKRWVLAAIFVTSLLYFTYNTIFFSNKLLNDGIRTQVPKNYINAENVLRKLKWHGLPKVSPNESTLTETSSNTKCRNSLQGQEVIADEEGFVCNRKDSKNTGCCDLNASTTQRYVCVSCLFSNCCSVYEHCVSCCMKPDKRGLLEKIIRETVNNLQQMVLATIDDQFDLCLTKCRTSSNSVQHENTYRDSKFKYCFGRNVPDIKPV